MTLQELLTKTVETPSIECWDDESTASALDNSEEVVREHYSHIEAGELADQMTSAFKEADGQESSESVE